MVSIRAGEITNNNVPNLSPGVNTYNIPGCNLVDDAKEDVIVTTTEGIYQSNKIVK
jgi:hypothetical protein